MDECKIERERISVIIPAVKCETEVNHVITVEYENVCVCIVKVILWPTVSQPWSVSQSVFVSGTHLGPMTNFSPSFFNFFGQLRVY
jgi:hypothetical protein